MFSLSSNTIHTGKEASEGEGQKNTGNIETSNTDVPLENGQEDLDGERTYKEGLANNSDTDPAAPPVKE
ncbi:MAG: hypothetical protein ABIT96_10875 [Ferruginibacter sp.]